MARRIAVAAVVSGPEPNVGIVPSSASSLLLLFLLIAAFVVVDFVPLCVAAGGAVAVAAAAAVEPSLSLFRCCKSKSTGVRSKLCTIA